MSLSKSARLLSLAFVLALQLALISSCESKASEPQSGNSVQATKADPNQSVFNTPVGGTVSAPLMSADQRNEFYGKFVLIIAIAVGGTIAIFAWKTGKPKQAVTMEEAHSAYDGAAPKTSQPQAPGTTNNQSGDDTASGAAEQKDSTSNQSS
jgi:hypothetical protein